MQHNFRLRFTTYITNNHHPGANEVLTVCRHSSVSAAAPASSPEPISCKVHLSIIWPLNLMGTAGNTRRVGGKRVKSPTRHQYPKIEGLKLDCRGAAERWSRQSFINCACAQHVHHIVCSGYTPCGLTPSSTVVGAHSV
jgi:hypothetical protein